MYIRLMERMCVCGKLKLSILLIFYLLIIIQCKEKQKKGRGTKFPPPISQQKLDAAAAKINVVRDCFQKEAVRQKATRAHKERQLNTTIRYTTKDPVVLLDSIIDDLDAKHLDILTACVQKFVPNHYEKRDFDRGVVGYGGGNNVTYVGGYVQAILPNLMNQILRVAAHAAEQASWRPHLHHVGVRCIETLEYDKGGELLWHVDHDSIYTMIIMLSDHSQFQGGSFVISKKKFTAKDPINIPQQAAKEKSMVTLNPALHGGIIFDSNAQHGVQTITKGTRIVLAIEFWSFEDSTIFDLRPSP